jgi:adenylyltransferase/sulfurtransferase
MAEAGERYSRQVLFGGIGAAGQSRLQAASAVLVGCGALGSVQADLLVRAGLGRLRIIDRDFVELSNLQRQTLFTEEDAARVRPKASAAVRHLGRVNSGTELEAVVSDLVPGNAEEQLDGFDLILDGSDNFEVRFLINDVAVKTGRPWIYGGCVGAYGVCLAIRPGQSACLSCLMPEIPAPGSAPTCDTAGVIGPASAAVAGLQAAEALKILSRHPEKLQRGLVSLDLWEGSHQVVRIPRDGRCPTCAGGTFRYLDEGGGSTHSTRLCGRNAVQVSPPRHAACDLNALAGKLASVGEVIANEFLVRCRVGKYRLTVFRDGRAIVGGTEDLSVARSVYARYVGH